MWKCLPDCCTPTSWEGTEATAPLPWRWGNIWRVLHWGKESRTWTVHQQVNCLKWSSVMLDLMKCTDLIVCCRVELLHQCVFFFFLLFLFLLLYQNRWSSIGSEWALSAHVPAGGEHRSQLHPWKSTAVGLNKEKLGAGLFSSLHFSQLFFPLSCQSVE